ncbi:Oidioi.mRNA.OKI2018_I69.PAR.g8566.t1.cds [Oikopleura dioica]|uniref:Oidioi.mRNA.OKI2018_I69.PAR.g8566.t1.cds n=1 Tax=Oikopleura dioica TaxID=34765 RepID=A0ABN7RK25_OIKDI|nr:Oidioi.mRNA.OKI2018_I69.PAR.g8566.t1.cds [Oikopleura dioica]
MKTHKTASSTVQNLLFRYGLRHNLTIGVPKSGRQHHLLGYPHFFNKNMLQKTPTPVQLIASHVRFSEDINEVLPNATRITILRNPVEQFVSNFFFFHKIAPFKDLEESISGLEEFFKSPRKYFARKSWGQWMAKNSNFFDLGFSNDISNESEIREKVEKTIEYFDFIMISDRFDESLILVKEKFCWDWEDVLVFSKNVGSKNNLTISRELEKKIKSWNLADSTLYSRALQNFEVAIEYFGENRMKNEIETLRVKRQDAQEKCSTEKDTQSQKCKLLGFSEHDFTNFIWNKNAADS